MADRSQRSRKKDTAIALSIVEDAWTTALPDVESITLAAVRLALSGIEDAERMEVSVVLTNDAEIRALNLKWRNQDKPTNVLSFPGETDASTPDAPVLLGDVVVALETTRREVEQDGAAASLADHLTHLIVHGVLHLLGYDHEIEADADEMEQLETELLAQVGIPNPYQDHERRPS